MARLTVLFWTLVAALMPTLAWASVTAPPQQNLRKAPPVWMGYLLMFVLIAVVIVVSLISSKRGHQD